MNHLFSPRVGKIIDPVVLIRARVWRKCQLLNPVWLFATPWTIACQGCPWDFPGKNTGVDCHSLLQGIFPSQGSNPHLLWLLHYQWILYSLEPPQQRKFILKLRCSDCSYLQLIWPKLISVGTIRLPRWSGGNESACQCSKILLQEDFTSCGTTQAVCSNYWACTPWSLCSAMRSLGTATRVAPTPTGIRESLLAAMKTRYSQKLDKFFLN